MVVQEGWAGVREVEGRAQRRVVGVWTAPVSRSTQQ